MFYYDEPYEEHCCVYCEEHDTAKQDTTEFMLGILEQLYGKERYDDAMLENCLDEVAAYFGLKLPQTKLAIKPKSSMPHPITDQILDKWKSFNNQYLKSLTQ